MVTPLKLGLALSILAASGFAHADKLTKDWQKRYDVYVNSITSRDQKAFESYIAKDFYWVKADGTKLNRKAALAEFGGIFTATKITGGETVLRAIKKGPVVEIHFHERFEITMPKSKPFKMDEFGTDGWKLIGGKWQMIYSIAKPTKK